MNRVIVIAVLCILSITGLQAQSIGFGVKGGLNIANQDYEADGLSFTPDSKTTFHIGIFVPVMLSDKMGLQPEILYSRKGSDFEFFGVSSETSLTYIDIPILFRYQPIEIISLNLGPQFSVLTTAEQEINDGSTSVTADIKDQLKGLDLGLAVGGQVELPMGFVGGARYVVGLSDINDSSDVDATVKNKTIQIFVGWKFL